ncbi:MAG: DNA translocase FtsK [Planctomycetota bacterium]|jgi:hypothetical protein
MVALIDSVSGLIGGPAALAMLALFLIWGLFILLDINVRRRRMRFAGVVLFGISLSMLLGLTKPELLQGENGHGGAFGNWIYLNCKLVGMEVFAAFLAWIAMIASALLATDWLFIEYITDALGLSKPSEAKPETASAPTPQVRKPEPVSRPRPMASKQATPALQKSTDEVPAPKEAKTKDATEQALEEKAAQGIPIEREKEKKALPTNEWWIAAASSKGKHKVRVKDKEPGEETAAEAQKADLETELDEETVALQEEEEVLDAPVAEAEYEETEEAEEDLAEEDIEEDADEAESSEDDDEEWEYEDDAEEEDDEDQDDEAGDEEVEYEYEYEYVDEDEAGPEEEEVEYEEEAAPEDEEDEDEIEYEDDAEQEGEEEEIYPDEVIPEEAAAAADEEEISASTETGDEPAQEASLEKAESDSPGDYAEPFVRALLLIFEEQEASISLLQQKLGIGYTQAAKWIDRLEKEGIISPPEDSGKRSVIITQEELNRLVDSTHRDPSESKSI